MKKITYLFYVFVVNCFVGIGIVQAQSTMLNGLLSDLEHFAAKNQGERVHLHLDKPFYAAGEDIWIKSYVVIGVENKLSALSQVLYIDLLDDRDILIEQLNIPLVSGQGIADFQLPDTLSAGLYKLRAYTNWMRNFENFTFFEQSLPIFSPLEDPYTIHNDFEVTESRNRHHLVSNFQVVDAKSSQPVHDQSIGFRVLLSNQSAKRGTIKTDSEGRFSLNLGNSNESYQGHIELNFPNGSQKLIPVNQVNPENVVQFFPEGGSLLAGHDNKIAFKSVGSNGLGIDLEGTILDGQGKRLFDFKSLHKGTGSFVLHPRSGEEFLAEVKFSDGTSSTVKLPEVMASGITLSVDNLADDFIKINVLASPDRVDNQGFNLILQKEGEVFYAARRRLSATENRFSVPKDLLPLGITQVTILSDDLMPWSERNIFSLNESFVLPIHMNANKLDFVSREKVELDLEIGHSTDSVRFAALSAAIIDLDKMGMEKDESGSNIFSSLLISPYLRGAIEHPAQYFDENNPHRIDQLDLLMMTQAWSRIDWSSLHIDH